jgi:hypothetical protein
MARYSICFGKGFLESVGSKIPFSERDGNQASPFDSSAAYSKSSGSVENSIFQVLDFTSCDFVSSIISKRARSNWYDMELVPFALPETTHCFQKNSKPSYISFRTSSLSSFDLVV